MRRNILVTFSLILSSFMFGQEIKSIKITDLEQIIAESKTPLIVNFWATWCKPCMEELPYFQEEVKRHKMDSVQLLLVSLDFKEDYEKVISIFAAKRKITFPILWLNETNADYFCPKVDSAWSGAIPATLFINNRSGFRIFFEEQLSKEKLKKQIAAMLGL